MSNPHNLSLTSTDNPSTTTAFLLGQLVSKIDALNAKVDSVSATVNEKVASVTADVTSLKNFRLKTIGIITAICTTINLPGWIQLLSG
jgi:hypothetical protein